jgi:hypothetical protein
MLLRVRELTQGSDGCIAVTLNKGDVRVSEGDAELIRRVLARSDAELRPLIVTRDPEVLFPVPEAIPVEIQGPGAPQNVCSHCGHGVISHGVNGCTVGDCHCELTPDQVANGRG